MATKSVQYWQKRAGERLVESERTGRAALVRTLSVYDQAQKNIEKDIQSIYDNYAENGVLDVRELKKAIGADGAKEFMKAVSLKARKLGIDPNKIYDERYLGRLSRLEALQEQIKMEVMTIAPQEEKFTEVAYRKIIQENYSTFQTDLENVGIQPTFATLDRRVTQAILASKWAGGNYSSRVWGNSEKLAVRLPTIIGAALSTGQSSERTARQIRERFDVSKYEAVRLVRTETAYFHNESEAQSYVDDGIEEYTLDVTLDGHTSKICLNVDEGTVHQFKDRVVGLNWPPLHVLCRTVPRPILPSDAPSTKTKFQDRIARLDDSGENELKANLKEAWQKQMNPEKAAHDYNADMNILTQNLKNKVIDRSTFNTQLADLMDEIPDDYPLRGGLEKVAGYNGWVKPAYDKNQLKVTKMLKETQLEDMGININPDQAKFIVDNGIKIKNFRSSTDDIGGTYDLDTKTIKVDSVNVKSFGDELDQKNYINAVVQHELGHAVDQKGFRGIDLSAAPKFKTVIDAEVESSISKYRFAKGLKDPEIKKFFNDLTPEVYGNMAKSGEAVNINGTRVKVPFDVFQYQTQRDELFAEAYSIYNTNPEWMQANAPKLLEYFNLLIGQQ